FRTFLLWKVSVMNKTLLIQAIIDVLREEFETLQTSSKRTRAAGNDAESKAEGKYDTRSTEENYLADGLAKQASPPPRPQPPARNFLFSRSTPKPRLISLLSSRSDSRTKKPGSSLPPPAAASK
ncbi:MAG: hypothetical protein ACOYMS_00640, partial [Terrimicrobiaceae bacterium]